MFVDLVNIKIYSGKGGDGMVAFRREKYVPKGGPSGGDGGRGGHIIFEGDEGLSTLLDLRYHKHLKADDGEDGKSKRMDGKTGEDLIVKVPLGTTLFDDETNKVLVDITEHQQREIILKGGRGGRGNVKFTSSRNTAPEIAEKGEPGIQLNIRVELKLLADVGLVGMPSVGKSTLISIVSKSRPKIAPYHFTTLTPNLGVVGTKEGKSFVIADLPGLIEGASLGQGLGLQFLRHIERTRVILHLIDMGGFENRDPYEDYLVIQNELKNYKYDLTSKPQIIVANKMDLPNSEENLARFKSKYQGESEVIAISAATRSNIDLLMYKASELLEQRKLETLYKDDDFIDYVTYTFQADEKKFEIEISPDGTYNITGTALKRLFDMTDFSKDQSINRFARQLRSLGVDQALRNKGVSHGDTVTIFGYSFEFLD